MEDGIKTDSLTTLPGELIAARELLGLTISDLHDRTKISRAVLLGYEKGRTRPGARELKLLCTALRSTPNKLLFGDEEPFQNDPAYETIRAFEDINRPQKMGKLFAVLTRVEQDALLQLATSILTSRHGANAVDDIVNDFFGMNEEIKKMLISEAENKNTELLNLRRDDFNAKDK